MKEIKEIFKNNRAFLLVFVLALVYAFVYFAPQFRGERLAQYDIQQYRGMAQEIIETRDEVGEDPQWSGSLFGGMPAYLINVKYPAQLINNFFYGLRSVIPLPAAFLVFAILAMWLMLVMMGLNRYVAITGAFMYGLSTYFFIIIGVGHETKMWALAFAPLMIGAIHMTLKGDMKLGAVLTTLFTSFEVAAGHPQITYYMLMAMAVFWLSEAIVAFRAKVLRNFAVRTSLLLLAGVIALLSNFSHFWYVAEHTPYTMRGGSALIEEGAGEKGLDLDYATAWSYGRAESMNLLIPDFTGRASSVTLARDGAVAKLLTPYQAAHVAEQLPMYWGGQPYTAGPVYIGAVVFLLALFAFFLLSAREKWWILAAALLALLLAWGSNLMWFTELFFKYLPGYDKFRTVSMILVVVELLLPLLATLGLARLVEMDFSLEQTRVKVRRALTFSLAGLGGLILVMIIAGDMFFDFGRVDALQLLIDGGFPNELAEQTVGAMVEERRDFMVADAMRSLLFVMLAGAAVLAFALSKISRGVLISVLTVLVIVDLSGVGLRFLSHDDFQPASRQKFVKTAADEQILSDKGEPGYRVFNLSVSPFNDASTSYFHRSVGGYHGAKLSRYQDLIDMYLSRADTAVLDMLNTRYFILPSSDGARLEVQKRPSALGAAWFVDGVRRVSSPNEDIRSLSEVDLRTTAVVDESESMPSISNFGKGEIELVDYLPHRLSYKYKADADAFAVFSEIYYPKGWTLFVDGEPQPYFRANYLLRAAVLPAGEHTVEWRFRSPNWTLVGAVSFISSMLIALLSLAFLFRWAYGVYKNVKNE